MKKKRFKQFVSVSLFILMTLMGMAFKPALAVGTTGSLSGTVTDKTTGKPVENVFITVTGASGTYTATTDANGFYSLTGVSAGTYSVKFERVGYQTVTYDGILVSADASTALDSSLSTEVYKVKGVTVTAYRDVTTNPRQVMTNYGYSDKLIRELLPGPANLNLVSLYSFFPGVVTATDPYLGSGTHIRGGTGYNDIGYSIDGVPTYDTITGTFATNLVNVGTGRTDFYVGNYPVGYGNDASGYVNQIIQRGFGPPHGSLELQYGFWLDPGSRLPSFDPKTGNILAYNGQLFPNPFQYNLTFEGQSGKFHYYFNQIGANGGSDPLATGVDLKPDVFLGSNQLGTFTDPSRNTVINLNYDLDPSDDIQFLLLEEEATAYYYGLNPTATQLIVMPDQSEPQKNDLEKLEWHHRFNPGNNLSVRLWRFSPDVWFNFYDNVNTEEWRGEWDYGAQAEYQSQINEQNLVTVGAMYYYAKNRYWLGVGKPSPTGPYFSQLQGPSGVFETTSSGAGNTGVGVADTQTMAAWLNEEWRPFPKFTLDVGLRWDRQNYLTPGVDNIAISPWIDPSDPSTANIIAHKLLTDNGHAFSLPGCNASGVTNFCYDPGFQHPSFVTPRLGASYQVTDNFTVKASYGKFIGFAPARLADMIKTMSAASGVPAAQVDTPAVYTKPGNLPEFAEMTDLSFEYQLGDNSYVKVTPYLSHRRNPLFAVLLPGGVFTLSNGGTLSSDGVEFLLKTEDFHGLTGFLTYTYSNTRVSESPVSVDSTVGVLAPSIVNKDFFAMIPASYNVPHTANLALNYKTPGGKWEIAPNFSWSNGANYGLGADNLCALAQIEGIIPANPTSCAGTPNPLGETTADSLHFGSVFFGNLAVTYHVNKALAATLSIFNLWNSNQTSSPFPESYLFTPFFGYTQSPTYDPLAGKYYNLSIPGMRQYFMTLRWNY